MPAALDEAVGHAVLGDLVIVAARIGAEEGGLAALAGVVLRAG
ncbi:hypothetical protein ACFTWS_18450 [Streptomyces sp. NPDC057027]